VFHTISISANNGNCEGISNAGAKWRAQKKKINILTFFFACISCFKGRAKQNTKMPFLSHKWNSYISLKKAKTNKVGPTKK